MLTGRDAPGTGGGASPSDEWYRVRLAGMESDAVERMLSQTVRGQLRKLRRLGMLP